MAVTGTTPFCNIRTTWKTLLKNRIWNGDGERKEEEEEPNTKEKGEPLQPSGSPIDLGVQANPLADYTGLFVLRSHVENAKGVLQT